MASAVPAFRLVRCPKCFEVLVEFANVPVYQCGGCDTIIRSNFYIATQENVTPVSVEITGENVISGSLQNGSMNSSDNSPLNNRLNSSRVQVIASSLEVDNRVEPAAPSSSNYIESKAAINCCEKGESSNNGAQVIEDRERERP